MGMHAYTKSNDTYMYLTCKCKCLPKLSMGLKKLVWSWMLHQGSDTQCGQSKCHCCFALSWSRCPTWIEFCDHDIHLKDNSAHSELLAQLEKDVKVSLDLQCLRSHHLFPLPLGGGKRHLLQPVASEWIYEETLTGSHIMQKPHSQERSPIKIEWVDLRRDSDRKSHHAETPLSGKESNLNKTVMQPNTILSAGDIKWGKNFVIKGLQSQTSSSKESFRNWPIFWQGHVGVLLTQVI